LIIVFLAEIAIGIAGYLKHSELQGILEKQFNKTFDDFPNNVESQHAWSLIQSELECCGIKSYTDWHKIFPNGSLPSSCCPTLPLHQKNCVATSASKAGCMNKLLNIMDTKSLLLGVAGFGIAIVQLLGVVFACCLSRAFKEHYETV
jgi:CD63 antigen